jgi:hypothetical protein
MTKDAPAFDFYPERWTHGTRHMTKVERCDYMDLLCHQWTDDGLPVDPDMIARLIGYRKGTQVPPLVLAKFPVADDGRRRNAFLERLRTEQRERIAKAKVKSNQMHASRYGKQCLQRATSSAASSADSSPQAVLQACPPPTTHLPPLSPPSADAEGMQGERASPPLASAQVEAAPVPAIRTSRKAQPITDDWLAELAKRYDYADVPAEFNRAKTWIEAKPGRTLTRPFFVNWLNRIPPPPKVNGNSPPKPSEPADFWAGTPFTETAKP